MKKLLIVFATLFVFFLPFASQAQAESSFISSSDNNGNATISEPIKDDAFLTGNNVSISAPVGGEIFAAGNVVNVAKLGGRSVYAAGNVVTLDQGTGYNAFVAGNTVTLSGTYGHDVYAAGNAVTVKEGTVINGDLRIAGSTVSIAGTVKGNVYASGGQLSSSAAVGGNFSGKAGTYTFSGGSIAGDLNYQSKEKAAGLEKVAITGKTVRTDPPEAAKTSPYVRAFGWLVSLLATFLLGAALIALMPKKVAEQIEAVRGGWTGLAATGLVLLIIVPIVVVLAFATVIGWKIGLVILALFAILLLCSHAVAAVVLGQLIFKRFNRNESPWLSLPVGLATVSLLSAIPWIGWIASLAFFFGLVLPCMGSLAKGIRITVTNS